MNTFPALSKLRIGCVRYLNSRPLIHAYPGAVSFDHPSVLAPLLASGELDLALIPMFEIIRNPSYRVVDNVAIASRGAVYSVFLAYTRQSGSDTRQSGSDNRRSGSDNRRSGSDNRRSGSDKGDGGRETVDDSGLPSPVPCPPESGSDDLSEVRKIKTDPASMTSVNLMQVLLREFHGIRPELDAGLAGADGLGEAELLIGNQAIEFRRIHGERFKYLDLGAEWMRCTGLPFVFAAWALRPGVPLQAAGEIRRLKAESLGCLEEIIAAEADPDFARDYLTEKIRFDLGPAEKEGIALFAKLLEKHGLAGPSAGLTYL